LRIVAQVPDDPQPLGIGFNKNNSELLAAVNGALSGMKRVEPMLALRATGARPSAEAGLFRDLAPG
jgi:hypothetical protein